MVILTLTYADDWQLVTSNGEYLPEAFDRVLAFCDAIRVPIDDRKTHFWSTGSFGRANLRDRGLSVAHHCRALGAHMQLTRQHTNVVQQQRVASLKKLWPRLKLSCSPYHIKIRAIKMAAWPRALHGIASTLLGADAYRSLRSGAMQSLQADGAGVNPIIHLSLIEDSLVDPLFWSIMATFRTVRDCGSAQTIRSRLHDLAQPSSTGPKNTITYTLLQRLLHLGWSVTSTGQVRDCYGTFDLFTVGWGELTLRSELAWPSYVESQVRHRMGLHGLSYVHVSHTRKWLRTLSVSCRAAFVKVLNGAHITQDGKKYCDVEGSPICPWCECEDSRYHRFWLCPRFEACRTSLPPPVWNAVPRLPETLTCYGWSLRPGSMGKWLTYFAGLDHPAEPEVPESLLSQETLHIFTDGSCVDQGISIQRFAAWAYVIADVDCFGTDSHMKLSGVLPGLVQSAYLSGSFAILQALRLVFRSKRPAHIWCDCGAAVLQLLAVQKGRLIAHNHPHFDIWSPIQTLLNHPDMPWIQVTKVASHVSQSMRPTALQVWCCHFNDMVDALAVSANLHRGPVFETLLQEHRAAVALAHDVSRAIQQVQMQISLVVLHEADEATAVVGQEDSQTAQVPRAGVPSPAWQPLPPLTHIPSQAVRWYGDQQVRRILSWFWAVVGPPHSGAVRWMSFFQLFVDFQMATGNHLLMCLAPLARGACPTY